MGTIKTEMGLTLPDASEKYSVDLYNNNFSVLESQYNNTLKKVGVKEYDSSKTYQLNDVCSYGGALYRCIFDIKTPEEWTSSHWTETSIYSLLESLDKKADEIENKIKGDIPEFEYDETGKITGYKTSIGGADTVFPFSSGSKIESDAIIGYDDNATNYIIPSSRFMLEIIGYRNMYTRSTSINKYTINGATVEKEVGKYFHCICSSGYSCVSGNVGVLKLICTGTPGDTIDPVVYFKESSGATGEKAKMTNWIVTMVPLSD